MLGREERGVSRHLYMLCHEAQRRVLRSEDELATRREERRDRRAREIEEEKARRPKEPIREE